MSSYAMLINGQLHSGIDSFAVVNPATEAVIAECPIASVELLEQAVNAAKIALIDGTGTLEQRRELLRACADKIEAHQQELSQLLTKEQGKPISQAQNEVSWAIGLLRKQCELDIPKKVLRDDTQARVTVTRKPLGVVAGITPWNFPFYIAVNKMAEAIYSGNSIIIKPSPYTPLTTLKLGKLIQDIIPAGLVNIISGDNELGALLVKHPKISAISFTGSVATGKHIATAAAADLKRVVLELGGNDAAIVLNDVNVKEVAEKIFWNAFSNCGQICVAVKRLYVQRAIYHDLLDEMVRIAKTVKVGNGLDSEVTMGPLNNVMQYERIIELLNDAKAQGATVHCGGAAQEGLGYFFPPTIISGIEEGVRLIDEEQFGPLLPILAFDDVNEVIQRVNNSSMGLSAYVWSKDNDLAVQIANRLEVGIVRVNTPTTEASLTPFGGMKQSGIGREGGVWGIEAMTDAQTMSVKY
ncbi:Succinate-semialdehyde dehydrogenase [NADP(+)] GabD [Piscirickettsia salmonis]|uniref:aldehyde dehydrogenase family protein n=1 Tax=Piscirickettsia salmonis TaxID=1238 RepID=UPI0012BA95AA|nr:aldehyde dehydrogenase family protein [Piscirickettsia salmonis]QGP56244.1 Succinate-semialdehyde dehydrogenase [NADP(+)] GabD [Piscirickettsia salmonis]QGP57885.1 Succinate-semialdehyde dehydrogenase [NADP(+)] GabD [Piscirickettsia salmonis]QGP65813.1 Succinate-semialdehyde dehydrogenase [NADP(+)] GabD [Piscirickettsia salmonis]